MATSVVKSPDVHIPIPPVIPVGPVMVPTGGVGTAVNTVKTVKNTAEATVKVGEALLDPHFWLRVGEGTVGLVLIIIGVNKLFSLNLGSVIPRT